METKQTAVEWLFFKMNRIRLDYEMGNLNDLDFIKNQKKAFDQSKAMEKEQIMDAAHHGVDFENSPFENAEQYYNETYGNHEKN